MMAICHFCNTQLIPKLDFGKLPLANNFLDSPDQSEFLYDGVWSWCPECELLQLENPPSAEQMFTEAYPYRTSSSAVMERHFKDTAEYLYAKYRPTTFGEIGCNDGGVAQFMREKCATIGFESARACWPTLKEKQVQNFNGFNQDTAKDAVELLDGCEFDVIYAANTLRSIPDLEAIFQTVENVLSPWGMFIIEEPYLPAIIEHGEIDQFYDEATYLFTVRSMKSIVRRYGFCLSSIDVLQTHGGSIRYHLMREDECTFDDSDLDIIVHLPDEHDLSDMLDKFMEHVDQTVMDLLYELSGLKLNSIPIVGFGATAKSSTMLGVSNINSDLLECIYDSTPTKIGKYTPLTHILIEDSELFKHEHPDTVVLLLAWNHEREIISKYDPDRRHRWMTYVPEVRWL